MTEDQSQSRLSYGRRHEYILIAELLGHGFHVYIPLVDDEQIDCIIRRGNDHYLDLQSKARLSDGNFAAMNIPYPRKNYFFVFYVEHIDTRWIFPSLKLVEAASQDQTGSNAGRYNIYLTSRSGGEVFPSDRFAEYIDFSECLGIDREFERLRGPKE